MWRMTSQNMVEFSGKKVLKETVQTIKVIKEFC